MLFQHRHFSDSGKYLKLDQIHSTKQHIIYHSFRQNDYEHFLTKIMVIVDNQILRLYQNHLNNNVIPYIYNLQRDQAPSLLLLQKYGEIIINQKYNKDEDDQEDNNQKTTIFLSKPYIYGSSLRNLILNKDKLLKTHTFCDYLIGFILDSILINGGIQDFIITTENIIYQDCGYLHLNYFSFTGLEILKSDQKFIIKENFEEILPYLSKSIFEEKQLRKIDIEMELNFIVINFISCFFHKDVIFQQLSFEPWISFNKDVKEFKEVKDNFIKMKSLFPSLLSAKQITLLKSYDKEKKTNFEQLVNLVLKGQPQENEGQGQQLSWQFILNRLSPEIDKKYEQNQQHLDNRTFEVFDHVIILLNSIVNSERKMKQIRYYLNDYRKIDKIMRIGKKMYSLRQKMIGQGRYIKQIFIPSISGMTFVSILSYKDWYHFLLQQTKCDAKMFQAVEHLQEIILDLIEILEILDPVISMELLRNNKSKYRDTSKKSSYYSKVYDLISSYEKAKNSANIMEEQTDNQLLKYMKHQNVSRYLTQQPFDRQSLDSELSRCGKQLWWQKQLFPVINDIQVVLRTFILKNGKTFINSSKRGVVEDYKLKLLRRYRYQRYTPKLKDIHHCQEVESVVDEGDVPSQYSNIQDDS